MSVGEYGLSVVELHPLPVIILYGLDCRWESTNCLEWNCPSAIYYSIILDLWWESTDCLEWNRALCQLHIILYDSDCQWERTDCLERNCAL